MPHSVFVVDTAAAVAAGLDKRDRRAYDAAIAGLKGEGCKAAGYRLAALDGGDYAMCCKHLANDWRLHTVFLEDRRIVVISLAEHDQRRNPQRALAEALPGLNPTGRRKRKKPACCEHPQDPPVMSATLNQQLRHLFAIAPE